MKVVIWIVAIAIVVWAGFTILNQGRDTVEGPIKIGFIGPLTGDVAGIGENVRIAVDLAKDEINEARGIHGRRIEVIYEDGRCSAKEAANAGNKLININKVVAIVGGLCSSETLAVAPMAEEAGVPLISAASTNPDITNAGDYIFRFVPSDSFQGKFAAEHIVNTLGHKKVGALFCLSDWCVGIKEVFKAHLTELGGELVAEEGYAQDTSDLRSQITKVKAASPDIVYFVGYTEASIIGLKQIKELGLETPIFGADAWDDPKIPAEAGAAADGATYSITANRELPQSFIDEMNTRAAGGSELNTYSPRGYDVMKVLADIMIRVGTDQEKIKAELYNIQNYQGIADTYTLDENGDVSTANFTIKKFKGGKIIEAGADETDGE